MFSDPVFAVSFFNDFEGRKLDKYQKSVVLDDSERLLVMGSSNGQNDLYLVQNGLDDSKVVLENITDVNRAIFGKDEKYENRNTLIVQSDFGWFLYDGSSLKRKSDFYDRIEYKEKEKSYVCHIVLESPEYGIPVNLTLSIDLSGKLGNRVSCDYTRKVYDFQDGMVDFDAILAEVDIKDKKDKEQIAKNEGRVARK